MAELSLKQSVIKGVAWTIAMRWAVKGIGFINTVIMARLLMPEDYGVVAMAMLVVGLIGTFLELNAGVAILRQEHVTDADVNSAWSLRLLQSLALGILVAAASWPAAWYFEEPRVTAMLWVLAACVAFSGLGNMGVLLAQKRMDFQLQFRQEVIGKVLSVLTTIALGWWLGDYRALLGGLAVGYVGGTVLSYLLHPHRPSWDTSRFAHIWDTSKWLMIGHMGHYVLGKSDELAAARMGTTGQYGQYNVGADLGGLPVASVAPAALQALLPAMAKLESDPERLRLAVVKTLSALNGLTLPLSVGVAALAQPFTQVVLGSKWTEAAVFVAIFSLANGIRFTTNPLQTFMVVRGQTKLVANLSWYEFAAFIAAALLMAPLWGLTGLALARVAGVVVNCLIGAWASCHHGGLRWGQLGTALLRHAAGASLMGLAIWSALPLFGPSALLQLLAGSALGFTLFMTWAFGTWAMAGRPEGFESTLLEQCQRWRRA